MVNDLAGTIYYLVFAAIWAVAAYFVWPGGVTDVPLAGLTLGVILRVGACAVLCLFTLASLFGAITDALD